MSVPTSGFDTSLLRQKELQQSLECQKKLLAYEMEFQEQYSSRIQEATLMREAASLLSSVTKSRDHYEKMAHELRLKMITQEEEQKSHINSLNSKIIDQAAIIKQLKQENNLLKNELTKLTGNNKGQIVSSSNQLLSSKENIPDNNKISKSKAMKENSYLSKFYQNKRKNTSHDHLPDLNLNIQLSQDRLNQLDKQLNGVVESSKSGGSSSGSGSSSNSSNNITHLSLSSSSSSRSPPANDSSPLIDNSLSTHTNITTAATTANTMSGSNCNILPTIISSSNTIDTNLSQPHLVDTTIQVQMHNPNLQKQVNDYQIRLFACQNLLTQTEIQLKESLSINQQFQEQQKIHESTITNLSAELHKSSSISQIQTEEMLILRQRTIELTKILEHENIIWKEKCEQLFNENMILRKEMKILSLLKQQQKDSSNFSSAATTISTGDQQNLKEIISSKNNNITHIQNDEFNKENNINYTNIQYSQSTDGTGMNTIAYYDQQTQAHTHTHTQIHYNLREDTQSMNVLRHSMNQIQLQLQGLGQGAITDKISSSSTDQTVRMDASMNTTTTATTTAVIVQPNNLVPSSQPPPDSSLSSSDIHVSIASYISRIQELENQLKISEQQIDDKDNKSQLMTHTVTSLEEEIKHLNQSIEHLETSKTESMKRVQELEEEIMHLETSNKHLATSCDTTTNQVNIIKQELNHYKELYISIQQTQQNAEDCILTLRKELQQIEDRYQSMVTERDIMNTYIQQQLQSEINTKQVIYENQLKEQQQQQQEQKQQEQWETDSKLKLISLEQELFTTQESYTILLSSHESTKIILEQMENEYKTLNKTYEEVVNKQVQVEEQLKRLQQAYDTIMTEKDVSRSKQVLLEQELQEFQSISNKSMAVVHQESTEQIIQLSTQLDQLQVYKATCEIENQQLILEKDNLTKELKEYQESKEFWIQNEALYDTKIKELEEKLVAISSAKENLQMKYTTAQEQLDERVTEISSLKLSHTVTIEKMKENNTLELQTLQEELLTIKESYQNQLVEHQNEVRDRVEECNKSIQERHTEYTLLQQSYDKLEHDFNNLVFTLDEMIQSKNNIHQEYTVLQAKYQELDDNYINLVTIKDDLETRYNEVVDEVHDFKQQNCQLKVNINDMEIQLSQTKKLYEETKHLYEASIVDQSSFQNQLQALGQRISDKDLYCEKLVHTNSALNDTINTLKQQTTLSQETYNSAISTLENELKTLQEQSHIKVQDLTRELGDLRVSHLNTIATIDESSNRVVSLVHDLSTMTSLYETTMIEYKQLQAESIILQTQIHEDKRVHDEVTQTLRTTIHELESKITDLHMTVQSSNTAITTYESTKEDINSQLLLVSTDNKSLRMEKDHLHHMNNELNPRIISLDSEITTMKKSKQEIEKERDQYQILVTQYEREINEVKETLERIIHSREDISHQLKEAHKLYDILHTQYQQLDSINSEDKNIISQLSEELENSQKVKEGLIQQISTIKEEITYLSEELQKNLNINESLYIELSQFKSTSVLIETSHQASLDEVQSQLYKLQMTYADTMTKMNNLLLEKTLLQKEVEESKERRATESTEHQEIQSRYTHLMEELDLTKSEYEKSLSSVKDEISQKDDAINTLELQLSQSKRYIDELIMVQEHMKAQVIQLETDMTTTSATMTDNINNLTQQNSHITHRLSTKDDQLNEQVEAFNTLKMQKESLDQELTQLRIDYKKTSSLYQAAVKSKEIQSRQLDELEQKLTAMKQQYYESSQLNSTYMTQLTEVTRQLEEVNAAYISYKEESQKKVMDVEECITKYIEHNSILTSENEQLKIQLQDKEKDYIQLQSKYEKLQHTYTDITHISTTKEIDYEELQRKYQNSMILYNQANQQLFDLESKYHHSQQAYDKVIVEKEELVTNNTRLKDTIASLETQMIHMNEQTHMICTLNTELDEMKAASHRVQDEMNVLTNNYNEALVIIEDMKLVAAEYENNIIQLKQYTEKVTSERENVKAESDSKDKQLSEMESMISVLRTDAVNMKSASDSKDKQLSEMESVISVLRTDAVNMKSASDSKDKQLSEMESAISVLRADAVSMKSASNSKDKQLSEMESVISVLRADAVSMKSASDSKDKQLSEMESVISVLRADAVSMKSASNSKDKQLSEMESVISVLRADAVSMKSASNSKDKQLSEMESVISVLRADAVSMKSASDSKDKQLSEMESMITDLTLIKCQLETSYGDLNHVNITLQTELNESRTINCNLSTQLDEIQSKLSTVENELNSKMTEIITNKEVYQESLTTIETLNAQLVHADKKYNDIDKKYTIVASDMNDLQVRYDILHSTSKQYQSELHRIQQSLDNSNMSKVQLEQTIQELQQSIQDIQLKYENQISLQEYEKSDSIEKLHQVEKQLHDMTLSYQELCVKYTSTSTAMVPIVDTNDTSSNTVVENVLITDTIDDGTNDILTTMLTEKENHIVALESTITTLTRSHDQSIQSLRDEYTHKIDQLQTELVHIQHQEIQLIHEKELYHSQIELLSNELANTQENLLIQKNQLTSHISDLGIVFMKLKSKLSILHQEKKELSIKVKQLKKELFKVKGTSIHSSSSNSSNSSGNKGGSSSSGSISSSSGGNISTRLYHIPEEDMNDENMSLSQQNISHTIDITTTTTTTYNTSNRNKNDNNNDKNDIYAVKEGDEESYNEDNQNESSLHFSFSLDKTSLLDTTTDMEIQKYQHYILDLESNYNELKEKYDTMTLKFSSLECDNAVLESELALCREFNQSLKPTKQKPPMGLKPIPEHSTNNTTDSAGTINISEGSSGSSSSSKSSNQLSRHHQQQQHSIQDNKTRIPSRHRRHSHTSSSSSSSSSNKGNNVIASLTTVFDTMDNHDKSATSSKSLSTNTTVTSVSSHISNAHTLSNTMKVQQVSPHKVIQQLLTSSSTTSSSSSSKSQSPIATTNNTITATSAHTNCATMNSITEDNVAHSKEYMPSCIDIEINKSTKEVSQLLKRRHSYSDLSTLNTMKGTSVSGISSKAQQGISSFTAGLSSSSSSSSSILLSSMIPQFNLFKSKPSVEYADNNHGTNATTSSSSSTSTKVFNNSDEGQNIQGTSNVKLERSHSMKSSSQVPIPSRSISRSRAGGRVDL